MQNDVAGHLEKKIPDKKYSRAEAVNGLTKAQACRHLQLGKTDIDAI
jgi:hypothetical protein